jgi:hypothetical protein
MVRDAWAAALRRRVAAAWACALAAGAVGLWLGTASPVAPRIQELVYETVLVRADPETTNTSRQKSNEVAMQIVADTYGLGVGLGSHRASSYVASLASNTGLVGAILFAAMLAALLRPYVRAANPADGEIFVAAALVGATLAVSLSIPDLNIPLYWAFVFLAFFCRPEPGSDRGRVDAST